MRADEAIIIAEFEYLTRYRLAGLTNYLNKLRYERLMDKARNFLKQATIFSLEGDDKREVRCLLISVAYESRAERIKEEM